MPQSHRTSVPIAFFVPKLQSSVNPRFCICDSVEKKKSTGIFVYILAILVRIRNINKEMDCASKWNIETKQAGTGVNVAVRRFHLTSILSTDCIICISFTFPFLFTRASLHFFGLLFFHFAGVQANLGPRNQSAFESLTYLPIVVGGLAAFVFRLFCALNLTLATCHLAGQLWQCR